jgi:hypothetical protein
MIAYLGHPIEQTQPKEMRELRGIYTAVNNGEASWAEAIESKGVEKPAEKKAEPQTLTDVAKAAKEETKDKKTGAPASSR